MDHRFPRRFLGVAGTIGLSISLLAPTPALPSEEPIRLVVRGTKTGGNGSDMAPQPLSYSENQLTAAVVLPPGVQRVQPQHAVPDRALRQPGEDVGALRNGLIHSSNGIHALMTGDRAKAQEELAISMSILSKVPEAATPDSLRLQLIEETAHLKAALSSALPSQEARPLTSEQEEEDEADTEAAPDLVAPEEASRLAPAEDQVVSMPELDLSDFDVPIALNEQVKAYILYYQTRKWGVMNRAFERSGRYLSMMRGIFRDQGLPLDLINLAYIESTFNFRAYSKAKASGIWQFIKGTGNRYGMKVNYWLDERRDPEKATRGAATYLKELYGMFQSWPLALAAYNAGEHRIQRAIEQQGTTDFWSLRLPKETQLFVPAFMAITIIAKDPSRYGFTAPVEKPWEVERVTVPGAIELRSVARAVGVSSDLIRDLNPALMRGVTPVTSARHEINLPPGAKEILLANLDQLPRIPSRTMVQAISRWHRVKRGETLVSIASRHQTTAAGLASLNGVKVGDKLKVGALLRLVPTQPSSERAITVAQATRSRTVALRAPEVTAPARSTVHIVKPGDTLFGIARAYAVTPEELRRWNDTDLRGQTKLRPGQALRLGSGQAVQVKMQAAKSSREARRSAPASTASATYHRVKRGDTLWEIARVHDVTPEELRRWNDLGRQAKLQVGQELMIRPSKS
ncbi:LysM peptidoglycan-binding domain-containing protein [Candidatus Methylomirabilis sp.]|uniref:lytic transglycosylase n=1 Tax=Candidatus Methylomirabilis sp. TaxID=2032687 RepID=UPI002A5B47F8|nr:LysM peptidoglycan-binding domain-containing protein [Candidatus Methylomirabilis sp.]